MKSYLVISFIASCIVTIGVVGNPESLTCASNPKAIFQSGISFGILLVFFNLDWKKIYVTLFAVVSSEMCPITTIKNVWKKFYWNYCFSGGLKTSWTEFCSNVNKNTASCDQAAINQYFQHIDTLHKAYKTYGVNASVNAITQVCQEYLITGHKLSPQIKHSKLKSVLKQTMDICKALPKNRQLTNDQINEFIRKSHATVMNCIHWIHIHWFGVMFWWTNHPNRLLQQNKIA